MQDLIKQYEMGLIDIASLLYDLQMYADGVQGHCYLVRSCNVYFAIEAGTCYKIEVTATITNV